MWRSRINLFSCSNELMGLGPRFRFGRNDRSELADRAIRFGLSKPRGATSQILERLYGGFTAFGCAPIVCARRLSARSPHNHLRAGYFAEPRGCLASKLTDSNDERPCLALGETLVLPRDRTEV